MNATKRWLRSSGHDNGWERERIDGALDAIRSEFGGADVVDIKLGGSGDDTDTFSYVFDEADAVLQSLWVCL